MITQSSKPKFDLLPKKKNNNQKIKNKLTSFADTKNNKLNQSTVPTSNEIKFIKYDKLGAQRRKKLTI